MWVAYVVLRGRQPCSVALSIAFSTFRVYLQSHLCEVCGTKYIASWGGIYRVHCILCDRLRYPSTCCRS